MESSEKSRQDPLQKVLKEESLDDNLESPIFARDLQSAFEMQSRGDNLKVSPPEDYYKESYILEEWICELKRKKKRDVINLLAEGQSEYESNLLFNFIFRISITITLFIILASVGGIVITIIYLGWAVFFIVLEYREMKIKSTSVHLAIEMGRGLLNLRDPGQSSAIR